MQRGAVIDGPVPLGVIGRARDDENFIEPTGIAIAHVVPGQFIDRGRRGVADEECHSQQQAPENA
jgi:hypothetical protein